MLKAQLRKEILQKRQDLTRDSVEELSLLIQNRVFKAPFWPKSGRIALYAPIKNEVMTQTIFQRALEDGLRVFFPRVEQGIRFYEVNGPEDLHRGCYSIMEPKRYCALLMPEDKLDVIFVPGIVFSHDCHRLGYGQGFYDKFFKTLDYNVTSIGLAYGFQVVEQVPCNEWDVPLTGVMTEKRFLNRS